MVCVFLSSPSSRAARTVPGTLTLKGEVRVYRGSVMLSDLVEETVDDGMDRFIVSSPPWGSTKYITKNFIRTRLPKAAYVLKGPGKVLVERPLKDRSEEVLGRLEHVIAEELSKRFEHVSVDSVRVEFVRVPEEMELPPGGFELNVRLPGSIYGYSVVNFDLRGQGDYSRHLAVGCRFHINAVCAVSSREIKKGERITEDDVKWKKVDLSNCYEKPLIKGGMLIGMRAKRLVPRGSVIPASAVERFPDILKGSEVSIEISKGSMRISARGRSLQDGYIGEKVLVKNLVNNRIEKYEVVAPGIVSPSSRRETR